MVNVNNVSGSGSNAAQDKVLGKITITKAYEGEGGIQIILDHDSVTALLQATNNGQMTEEDGEQVFTPNAVKRSSALLLSVRTPKGKTGRLVWGDTHALHASHQAEPDFFGLILNAARTQAFELEVINAEPTTIRGSKKGNKPLTLSTDI